MMPGSKRLIGAVVLASVAARAGPGAGPRRRRMDDEPRRRAAGVLGEDRRRLTKDAVQKGELKFLWKMKLDNESRQLNSLTTPVLMDRLISHRGFKALAFIGASAERVYAIDTDLARVYWTTVINYSSITPPANSTWACPGGLMAAATRPDDLCGLGVRRWQRRRARRRLGKLRRRAGQGRAEPGARRPGSGRAWRGAERSGARRSRRRAPGAGAPRPVEAAGAAGSVAGRPTTSSSWRATATRGRSIHTTAPTACRRCHSSRRMPGRRL